jgi:hypothetical protein
MQSSERWARRGDAAEWGTRGAEGQDRGFLGAAPAAIWRFHAARGDPGNISEFISEVMMGGAFRLRS